MSGNGDNAVSTKESPFLESNSDKSAVSDKTAGALPTTGAAIAAEGDGTKTLDATMTTEKPPIEISTKEAYFASLNAWAKQAAISHNAMAMFPFYLLNSYPQFFQNQLNGNGLNTSGGMPGVGVGPFGGFTMPNTASAPANLLNTPNNLGANNNTAAAARLLGAGVGVRNARLPITTFRVLDEQTQANIINSNGGYDYVVAPFWKRAIAETIDWLILLLVKVIVTFTIMNIFDLDIGFELSKDVMRKAFEDDEPYASILEVSMDFITLSSDLLLIEMLTKFLVCCYEAFWTTWYNGATPGKAIMKIKILYVEAVLPLQAPPPPQFIFQPQREPVRALLFPAETPGLKRAFIRALAKNLVMTLLFPVCVIMVFFKNNRTAYDIVTKTIVVESNPNATLRRQQ